MWYATARTAGVSLQRWDAKLDVVLRDSLSVIGLKDEDIKSSVHQVMKDKNGEYVMHRISLDHLSPTEKQQLIDEFQGSGATVREISKDNAPTLLINRGNRTFQEITYNN